MTSKIVSKPPGKNQASLGSTRGVTVGDLIQAMFGDTGDEEYSVSFRGKFGEAGLRRANAQDNERADNEPFGDWHVSIGKDPVTIVIHDEDEARPQEGQRAFARLGSAMAACGRRLVRQSRRGTRRSATYSAGVVDEAAELARFRAWRRNIPQ